MGFLPFPSILRGGVMVTCVNGSDKLKVRFFSPAPIFIAFVLFFVLCGSAGAISLEEGVQYDFNDFPYWLGLNSVYPSNTFHYPSDQVEVPVSNSRTVAIIAKSGSTLSGTGTGYNYNVNLDCFDYPSPNFRFIHLGFSARRYESIELTIGSPTIGVFVARKDSTYAYRRLEIHPSVSNGVVSLGSYAGNYGTVYASDYQIYQNSVHFDYFLVLPTDYYLCGFSFFWNPGNTPEESTVAIPSDLVPTFVLSSEKIIPPVSSGSGSGSVDLSGITSQITQLSNDMSAQFLAVNQNIDSAESAITSAIEDQTTALSDSIDQAAQDVNDHFDTWDTQLSGAFSSNDAQVIVDTDQSVSALHQFEQDQIDETDSALSSLGLDSYTIPSEYLQGSQNIGTFITLLFGSLSFVTPLVIFSCMLGIAAVLIGRKSKGDG